MDVLLLEVSVPSDEYDNRVQAIQEEAKASGDNEMIAAAAVLTTASDNAEADFLITGGIRARCEALASEDGGGP
jgi:hypothetical protein